MAVCLIFYTISKKFASFCLKFPFTSCTHTCQSGVIMVDSHRTNLVAKRDSLVPSYSFLPSHYHVEAGRLRSNHDGQIVPGESRFETQVYTLPRKRLLNNNKKRQPKVNYLLNEGAREPGDY